MGICDLHIESGEEKMTLAPRSPNLRSPLVSRHYTRHLLLERNTTLFLRGPFDFWNGKGPKIKPVRLRVSGRCRQRLSGSGVQCGGASHGAATKPSAICMKQLCCCRWFSQFELFYSYMRIKIVPGKFTIILGSYCWEIRPHPSWIRNWLP